MIADAGADAHGAAGVTAGAADPAGAAPPPAAALTPGQRHALLELASAAAGAAALGRAVEDPGPPPPGLDRRATAFVTLRVAGVLRGCIGASEPRDSLWSTVHEMASAAAARDPRFAPLGPADLGALGVEISVLSPTRRVHGPADIVIGRHGLEVQRGARRGVLLPQVATDHGLDSATFLAETCRKADLPPEAWRDPDTEIRVFEADVFGDGP